MSNPSPTRSTVLMADRYSRDVPRPLPQPIEETPGRRRRMDTHGHEA